MCADAPYLSTASRCHLKIMEFLLAIILVWAIIFGFVSGAWKEKDKAVAKKLYLESLSALKRTPANADIKRRTLALGRAYSTLTRDKSGRAAFSEVALMKDIDAACTAANADEHAELAEHKGQRAG